MRKYFLFILCLLVVMGMASVSGAQTYDRDPYTERTGYVNVLSTEVDEATLTGPAYVHAVTVFANAANSYVLLYDDANSDHGPGEEVKVEVGEATQYDSKREEFTPPVYFKSGVYTDLTNAHVLIEYR